MRLQFEFADLHFELTGWELTMQPLVTASVADEAAVHECIEGSLQRAENAAQLRNASTLTPAINFEEATQ